MTFELFQKLAKDYTAIPVYRRLLADTVTPVSLFLKVREHARYPFLLESVEGGEHLARYSFLGRNPFRILTYSGGGTTLSADGNAETLDGNFFHHLRELTTQYSEPKLKDLPSLTGGAVGYSAYDTVRLVEHLPNPPADDLNLPEAIWCFYDQIYAFDHVKHQIILIKTVFLDDQAKTGTYAGLREIYDTAVSSLDDMQTVTTGETSSQLPFSLSQKGIDSNTEKSRFMEMVEKAKSCIYEGDIFQVVLSQRFRTGYTGDRFMLYRALRMVNPSPYLFYLDFHQFALIGSSPEVLVRVQNGKAEVLPIAGTRPRGKTEEEDLFYENDLRNDPKEVAEHIMLVDLGRNDLSRICKSDTVRLVRNQVIERYSHVMHIVSDVTGQLKDEATSVDALMYCFPAGTVSGAPKVRAMEIIDEMEPSKRGPYAGAVGYFDFSGNMDTCIAIRTMVATDRDIYIQAGAGIVADSVPEREYEETVNKARALVEALSVALELNTPTS
ncbi:MAG: anthranilate synthase component I [Rhodothermaceae bacterium]|nr:anthranilate synthase component I [Rhodothermaceae bacterium]